VKSLETEKRNLQALINTNNITNDKIQGANIQLQNLTNQLSYLQKEVVNYQSRIPSFVSYEKMLSETNNLQNSILDLKKQYSQLISDIDTTRKNYERTKKLYDEALSKKYEIEHYKKEIEKDKILMKFMEFASTNNYSYSATHQSLSSISKEFRKICDDFSHTVYILFRDGIIDNDNALNFLELKNLSKNLSEFNKSSFLSKLNHLDLPSKKHIERLNEGVQTIVIDANKCIAELKNLKPELKKLNDKLTKYFL
jgi:predicted  nucleic acid-binding Zn-ribbon protein